jgi:hypothetical protein
MLKALRRTIVPLLLLVAPLASAAPALALGEGDISTRAFTNHALPLYDAPGNYHQPQGVIGMLPGGLEVRVDRCTRSWCAVHGRFGHGWLYLYSLSFGQGPNSIWWPPVERHGPYHPWPFLGD